MAQESEFSSLLGALSDLANDDGPRNVKTKAETALKLLQNCLEKNGDKTIVISKALHELEELTTDLNIDPLTRARLINVISLLESKMTCFKQ
ncbi:MAG: UPF0147 family protein [Candidatus Woesearchaeota archaeon]